MKIQMLYLGDEQAACLATLLQLASCGTLSKLSNSVEP